MEILAKVLDEMINRLAGTMKKIDPAQVDTLIDHLLEAKKHHRKILAIGAGRSGLVSRAFAMRLMHIDFDVHVVGETITPAVEKDDILFAVSGSGETTVVVTAAKIAKRIGAKIIAITTYPNSPLGKDADHVVVIPGRTKVASKKDYFSRQILGVHEPLAPLGTLFELSAIVFLDGLIVELMNRLGKTEEEMKRRHATIE